MSSLVVLVVVVLYLGLLFGVAYWADYQVRKGRNWLMNPYIYALSTGVYCSAWTFYGSVGLASQSGLGYLTTYLGPLLVAPLGWFLIRKMIRIARVKSINSLADFVAARYGKSILLGRVITLICIISIVPYISLQIKAITYSISILTEETPDISALYTTSVLGDVGFYVTLLLAIFSILFGGRNLRTRGKHQGMMTVIAFESLIKLVAFLAVGGFVCFSFYDGFADLFGQVQARPDLAPLLTLGLDELSAQYTWIWRTILAMLAFLMLPRQFQVMVIENENENHLGKSSWLFPLYLLAINFFVLPIALAGNLLLDGVEPDMYVLYLPLRQGEPVLALLAFIGGFSAATGMIIVSTVALSTMISNNFLTPSMIPIDIKTDVNRSAVSYVSVFRRLSILVVLLLAYSYYKFVSQYFSLVSIGLTAFVAIAQLAPATLIGLYWKKGNFWGTLTGLAFGLGLWFYTLILPALLQTGALQFSFVIPFPLHPEQLFGLQHFDKISHALFWSLTINAFLYVLVSSMTRSSVSEQNQAEIFVDILNYERTYEQSVAWNGTAYVGDLERLVEFFVGQDAAREAFQRYGQRKGINLKKAKMADAEFITYVEILLTGVIGAASARIMVSSMIQENEAMRIEDVMAILQESKTLISDNKELKKKTQELRQAGEKLFFLNQKLREQSRIRNDFVSTVTHELRTPLTSIRALSEIVAQNEDMEPEERTYFVQQIVVETERLTHLINEILDLERFESGKITLNYQPTRIRDVIEEALRSAQPLLENKKIILSKFFQVRDGLLEADRDRLVQVTLNLLSNAIKHTPEESGIIRINTQEINQRIQISVEDNGVGIGPENHQVIFEKFHQVRDKDNRKPQGTGLGLSIARTIVELHRGEIWVESDPGKGAKFIFWVPIHQPHENPSTHEYENIDRR